MTCICVWVAAWWVLSLVLVEREWDLGQILGGWGCVISVCVVSLNSLYRCQVQVSVYCAGRIPAHLRCTQCSILFHLIDICFQQYICLWQMSQIKTCLRVVVQIVATRLFCFGDISSSLIFLNMSLR